MNQNFKALVFDAYGTLYDVQSVEATVEAAFPGKGSLITSVWRMKQLEYTWLATLMERYEDFWSLTLRSLNYTLRSVGLSADSQLLQDIAAAISNSSLMTMLDPALSGFIPAEGQSFRTGADRCCPVWL